MTLAIQTFIEKPVSNVKAATDIEGAEKDRLQSAQASVIAKVSQVAFQAEAGFMARLVGLSNGSEKA